MGHLDPKQAPTKRKPYSAILKHTFIQRVELMIPEELFSIISEVVLPQFPAPAYSRVILPLRALLEGDFFNTYIKLGNILMLSEGRIGAENVYCVSDGKLRLHLDRESYERCGLAGKPDGVKGSRGRKPRWLVEIDLRQPSMFRGKKGFDRIENAFQKVLTNPVTWLFCDPDSASVIPDPLDTHMPLKRQVEPEITKDMTVAMPSLNPPIYGKDTTDFEEYSQDLHEWFSLVMLNSPRISYEDTIDPALSRYRPPNNQQKCRLVKMVWRGFIPPAWAHRFLVQIISSSPRNVWFALSITGFPEGLFNRANDCLTLRLPDSSNEYILWETS